MRPLVWILAAVASVSLPSPATQRPAAPPPKPAAQTEPTARRRAVQQEEAADPLPEEYFEAADLNKNGWIGFKEAEETMKLSREQFDVFDKDDDGRVDLAEFKERYLEYKRHGGAFPAPGLAATPTVRRTPRRTSAELIRAYDKDLDGGIDAAELGLALTDYGVRGLSPEAAMKRLDLDGSSKLDENETYRLVEIIDPKRDEPDARRPSTVDELFGRVIARASRDDSVPTPPLIPGPVSPFRRLDLDDDGSIRADDLIELSRPASLPVRVHALIAALDKDGDGGLSREEFWASMGVSAR